MKSKGRREEDRAKQACFISALNFIFATTDYNKVTKVTRLLVEEGDKKAYKTMKNLFYSIKNGRSTPPEYIAQQLYDALPSDELYDILVQQFPKLEKSQSTPPAENFEVPIEDELPEILLGRIRELKREKEENEMVIQELEEERDKILKRLQEIIEDPENETSARLVKFINALRESNLIL